MGVSNARGKIPFGLKEGRLHFVGEVDVGAACGCVCPDPACGLPLIARNKPSPERKRIFHFRHASLNAACGGRESALHQMAKQVVERAAALTLPAWRADELAFDAVGASLAPGTATEVVAAQGQIRSDVCVTPVINNAFLPALHVEIRVSHAVDWEKRRSVVASHLSMIEIDLSEVDDELLQNEAAFSELVLHQPDNRHWVHIGNPAFLSALTGQEIVQVMSERTREKQVKTKRGNTLLFQTQDVVRYSPGHESPDVVDIELADTYRDGQRVDQFGNALPYAPGLYRRCRSVRWSSFGDDFKTHLRRIEQDPPPGIQVPLL